MPFDIDQSALRFICNRRVARFATADARGRPAVIPICYVFDGENFYTSVDEKPKSVAQRALKRVRNIEANPNVALVIDDYSEDWSKLVYAHVSGKAEIMQPGGGEHARAAALLRDKYPQYRSMAIDERIMIKIIPTGIKIWESS
jgi:PPOX class probable F420-dependent enzyme